MGRIWEVTNLDAGLMLVKLGCIVQRESAQCGLSHEKQAFPFNEACR